MLWDYISSYTKQIFSGTSVTKFLIYCFWGFVTWCVKWALSLTHGKIMLNIYFQKSLYSVIRNNFHRAAKYINENYMERLKEYFLWMALQASLNFSNQSCYYFNTMRSDPHWALNGTVLLTPAKISTSIYISQDSGQLLFIHWFQGTGFYFLLIPLMHNIVVRT